MVIGWTEVTSMPYRRSSMRIARQTWFCAAFVAEYAAKLGRVNFAIALEVISKCPGRLLGQQPPGRLAQQLEGGEEVDLENPAQLGRVELVLGLLEPIAGVGQHDVEAAEALLGHVQQPRVQSPVSHVADDDLGGAGRSVGPGRPRPRVAPAGGR